MSVKATEPLVLPVEPVAVALVSEYVQSTSPTRLLLTVNAASAPESVTVPAVALETLLPVTDVTPDDTTDTVAVPIRLVPEALHVPVTPPLEANDTFSASVAGEVPLTGALVAVAVKLDGQLTMASLELNTALPDDPAVRMSPVATFVPDEPQPP